MTSVRPPVALVLPIIDACGGRCVMCGIWRSELRPPLPPDTLAAILADPAFSAALTHVNVTGGEPVSHPRFARIAEVLSAGCPALAEVNVNTSGLDAEATVAGIAEFRQSLAARIRLRATISLDGVGAVHDRVRGVRGAFAETERAIEGCLELARRTPNLDAHLNCTVSRANWPGFRDVAAWARQRGIGLTLTAAAANDLYLRNSARQPRFALDAEQAREFTEYLDGIQDDEQFPATERHYYAMLAGMLRGEQRSCACVYQRQGVFLDLDGTVYPCGTASGLPYGRLPAERFADIYYGERGDEVRRRLRADECPSCPTNSYHGLADGVWLTVLKKRRAAR